MLTVVLHRSGAADGKTVNYQTHASATVLHGASPRLLAYDGIDIEAPLTGTLVVIRNHDVPGVVGRIGTILGEHQINIANFGLGRAAEDTRPEKTGRRTRLPEGQALAVVQIDVPNPQSAAPALAALKTVEAIASVRLVELA